ncbi:MAG: peptidoglycan-binding protein [Clostridia bacterium]|nr:peptidoglycan-binding protein [Clostridia bacterium]
MSKLTRRCLSLVLAFMLLASISVSGTLYASADNKTGDGLAAYAMRAYNEGWSYVWGGASPGAVDCSGLIYSYVGGGARVTEDMLYSSPESGYVSNGVPDIPGIALWQPGHVGVYVGGGMAVDARDEISNVCYQSVATKSWVMWFKVAGVSYGTDDGETQAAVTKENDKESDELTQTNEDTDDKREDEDMKIGSTGAQVNVLQERLKELGYFTDNTTQYFGIVTQGALKEFQTAAGLDATGVLDADTKAAVFADSAPRKAAEITDDESDNDEAEFTTDEYTDEEGEADAETDEYTVDETDNTGAEITQEPEEEPLFTPEEGSEGTDGSDALYEEDETDEQSSANSSDEEESFGDGENAVYEAGDANAEISEIQYMLIKLGYFDYDITGYYCENTADAVELFRSDYDLGQARTLSAEAIAVLYSVYDGSYYVTQTASQEPMGMLAQDEEAAQQDAEIAETDNTEQTDEITQEGAAGGETEAETAAVEEIADSEAESKAQSVTITLGSDDEGKSDAANTESANDTSSDSGTNTSSKAAESTASEKPAASGERVVSPKTGNRSVVFIQTGAGDIFSVTHALIAIGISLVVIFFAGTVHYWNVSMERRRQRARRATTVAVYHRSLL